MGELGREKKRKIITSKFKKMNKNKIVKGKRVEKHSREDGVREFQKDTVGTKKGLKFKLYKWILHSLTKRNAVM